MDTFCDFLRGTAECVRVSAVLRKNHCFDGGRTPDGHWFCEAPGRNRRFAQLFSHYCEAEGEICDHYRSVPVSPRLGEEYVKISLMQNNYFLIIVRPRMKSMISKTLTITKML